MAGESKRGLEQDVAPIGANEDEEPAGCGFYVQTEANRVVLRFERSINFLQVTGKDAVELGRALMQAGETVRSRPRPKLIIGPGDT